MVSNRLLYTVPEDECAAIHYEVMMQETPAEIRAGKLKDVKSATITRVAVEHGLTYLAVLEILYCALGPVHQRAKNTAADLYEKRHGRKAPGRMIYVAKSHRKFFSQLNPDGGFNH